MSKETFFEYFEKVAVTNDFSSLALLHRDFAEEIGDENLDVVNKVVLSRLLTMLGEQELRELNSRRR